MKEMAPRRLKLYSNNRKILLLPRLLPIAIIVIIGGPSLVNAFQPDAVVHAVLQAAATTASGAGCNLPQVANAALPAPIDELLFVAANLLDGSGANPNSNSQSPRGAVLRPNRRGAAVSPYVSFPEVYRPAPSPLSVGEGDAGAGAGQLYDYESQSISRTIILSPAEHCLFELIRNVRSQYAPSTVVRVAGGWVRDKLLLGDVNDAAAAVATGGGNRDVDFVLSNVSGYDFAELVCRYLKEHEDDISGYGDTTTTAFELQGSKSASPQSNHLQTATLSLLGFDVDFARLRYDKYDTSSRIPETTDATIVQDAWRRDLTINSLYYNLNTNQVEDWTERGLQDLKLRTIVTPRKPLPTLLEDPVRILRAVRFAAQLSFSIDPALVRAARDVRVRHALENKVSRETIGCEVDSMFGTRDPTRGIKLLMETNMIDLVLPIGDVLEGEGQEETAVGVKSDDARGNEMEEDEKDGELVRTSMYYAGLDLLARTQALVCRIFTQAPDWDVSKRRYLWYAAFLQPIYGTTAALAADLSKRGRRNGSGFYRLLAAGLKRPKCDIQAIETILKGVEILGVLLQTLDDDAVRDVVTSTSTTPFRDLKPTDSQWRQLSDLRWLWYKALKPIGPLWKEALILALAAASNKGVISDAVDQFNEWVNFIENRLDLEDVVLEKEKLKPILNGSDVQRVLPGVSGNGFRRIMAAQEEWMVRNCMYSETIVDGRSSSHNDDARAEVIGYLAATFPEYATVVVER